jgi:hypothetical protein
MFLEVEDGLGGFAFGHTEVFGLEAVHWLAVFVLNSDIDDDQLGAGVKDGGRRILRRVGWGCGRCRGVLRTDAGGREHSRNKN